MNWVKINLIWLTVSFGLVGCVFVKPYEAKDSPDYPFSLRVNYDGECVAEISKSLNTSVTVTGKLSRGHPVAMRRIEEGESREYRSLIYTCVFADRFSAAPDFLMTQLNVTIFIDRFVENFDSYVTQDSFEHLTESGLGSYAFQLKEKPIALLLSKSMHDYRTEPSFVTSDELPFNYIVMMRGKFANPIFPRPWRSFFSCSGSLADFHSKDGVVTLNSMKNRVPNGTYMIAKGNLVIGGAACF